MSRLPNTLSSQNPLFSAANSSCFVDVLDLIHLLGPSYSRLENSEFLLSGRSAIGSSQSPKRAFTLIEALVTTLILALMALSAFPFLQSYQTRLNLEEAALSLQNCFISAGDYARAPSAGAVAYRATLEPANRRCVVERVTTTPELMDEYTFDGLDFTNSAGISATSFTLSVDTGLLHDVTYSTVVGGVTGQAFGSGTVTWTMKPTGKSSPTKALTVNLVHGIVTLLP